MNERRMDEVQVRTETETDNPKLKRRTAVKGNKWIASHPRAVCPRRRTTRRENFLMQGNVAAERSRRDAERTSSGEKTTKGPNGDDDMMIQRSLRWKQPATIGYRLWAVPVAAITRRVSAAVVRRRAMNDASARRECGSAMSKTEPIRDQGEPARKSMGGTAGGDAPP
ncbi:hypothetical protein K438DRAFT_1931327 [Mycena galopus ATCC 62051]|nr:hypothetical protein K438DRAFT_1931327 [Mycena galopus ATCC 62051]